MTACQHVRSAQQRADGWSQSTLRCCGSDASAYNLVLHHVDAEHHWGCSAPFCSYQGASNLCLSTCSS
jgi:hypothetical protein